LLLEDCAIVENIPTPLQRGLEFPGDGGWGEGHKTRKLKEMDED